MSNEPMKKLMRIVVGISQGVISLAVIAAALGLAYLLITTKPVPKRSERVTDGPLLNVVRAEAQSVQMFVTGNGTVEPRKMVQVVPQVSGKVTRVHSSLISGGFFEAGELLIEIDRADYELAVERAEAQLARAKAAVREADSAIEAARTTLSIEQAEARVREAEWRAEHPDRDPDPLVVREPQIRQAKAQLTSAQARLASVEAEVQSAQTQLAEAKLNLGRTRVSVPFAGRVLSESVDVGQFITAGQPLATVYGTAVAEVTVPLEDRELAWFNAPLKSNGSSAASDLVEAEVAATFAGARYTWPARVVRTGGQIDPRSRMVDVVIEVTEPFEAQGDRPPLAPGMFVDVTIKGRKIGSVVALPRATLREGDQMWVVGDGDTLAIRQVQLLRRERETVYVSRGVHDGELVVTDMIETVTDGMAIQPNVIDGLPGTTPQTQQAWSEDAMPSGSGVDDDSTGSKVTTDPVEAGPAVPVIQPARADEPSGRSSTISTPTRSWAEAGDGKVALP